MCGDFEIFDNELVKYTGTNKMVEIPSNITLIRDFAFYDSEQLETIVISQSVTSIGSYAFYGCTHLKDVQIPNTVSFIGGGAFSCCDHLEKITLPNSLRTIQKSTFYKCSQLKEVYLPSQLTTIEHSAFGFCSQLEHIDLPESLKKIGANAFEECASLLKIKLPNQVTTVGDNAFFHCTQLHEIIASEKLTVVGKGAFQTHSTLSFQSNDDLLLRSYMFDGNWNLNWSYSFRYKNGDNYCFVNSYLPHLKFREWKPMAKIVLLANFLETYEKHDGEDKIAYCKYCQEHKDELLKFLVEQKRFTALNQSLEQAIFTAKDVEPYFDMIVDREQKAKILNYQKDSHSFGLDDLENELLNLF